MIGGKQKKSETEGDGGVYGVLLGVTTPIQLHGAVALPLVDLGNSTRLSAWAGGSLKARFAS